MEGRIKAGAEHPPAKERVQDKRIFVDGMIGAHHQ